ncbi:MAG: cytidylyltransferase domain-containing protein [Chitinophagaceae bacterium]
MSLVAFIPVRGGSKSIPLKNIKLFCGKPLVYWNLFELENTIEVDKIVVATDSDAIESTVNSFGFKKVSVYRRSNENASDTASTESVMLEYLNYNKSLKATDLFMLVQATSPLTTSNHFKGAIQQLNQSKSDSLLSCIRIKRFFWSDSGKPLNYDFNNRPRRQDFDGVMTENGAFYINNVENILKDKCRLSGNVEVYEMPEYTYVEIDEEHDWILAEALMKKYNLIELNNRPKIKLFATDVDGVLTDAGMYYSESGDELKKFNTRDGKGIELLHKAGIKTAIITSENTKIVERRAAKLKVNYLYQGKEHSGKLDILKEICKKENISLSEVAYIGDDINCSEALQSVGWACCPVDAELSVKNIYGIQVLDKKGGDGVVREFIEKILSYNEK